ncbi:MULTISPECIES: TfoX/Sxy family protein [Pasteurellaceae]|nr:MULTISPECIES: TfoX/Sxy family protein [Pasteurellaceae]WGE86679.1 TfoX/Sxy family protein [Actinobacillus equuli subsp. haemolyticus]
MPVFRRQNRGDYQRRHRIFVKTNAETLPVFQAKGAVQYEYFSRGKRQKMHYWSIPDEDVEEREKLQQWFDLGIKALAGA